MENVSRTLNSLQLIELKTIRNLASVIYYSDWKRGFFVRIKERVQGIERHILSLDTIRRLSCKMLDIIGYGNLYHGLKEDQKVFLNMIEDRAKGLYNLKISFYPAMRGLSGEILEIIDQGDV